MKTLARAAGDARRGSILIYVLWLSALLALFTLSVGRTAGQRLTLLDRLEARRDLRLAADSAAARALAVIQKDPQRKQKANALKDSWSHNEKLFRNIQNGMSRADIVKPRVLFSAPETFLYGLTDESAKINLNRVRPHILKRLLGTASPLSSEDADIVGDSVADWIDADDHLNPSGAENRYYAALKRPLVPKNAPLNTLEELLYVRGVTPELLTVIEPYVTLYGDGRINVNTAPVEVLRAAGLPKRFAVAVVTFRQGPDTMAGSKDDRVYEDLTDLEAVVELIGGLDEREKQLFERSLAEGRLKTQSDVFSLQIETKRRGSREKLAVFAVVDRTTGILSWKESYSLED